MMIVTYLIKGVEEIRLVLPSEVSLEDALVRLGIDKTKITIVVEAIS